VPETHHEPRAEDLGARVRAVRELAGLQLRDVARATGMGRRELQAVERGSKGLTVDDLRALAGALGVDTDVLVGVGFEGDLVRAGTVDEQIDQCVGHDPEHWDDMPASVSDLPPALPLELPDPERRKDERTRNRIEGSWHDVRAEMGDLLTSCARLISAGSGDDVRRLVERLERDLQQLKSRRGFQRTLADHERALDRVRGTGGNVPVASADAATLTRGAVVDR
jgi:transcriptional regulator with XRE-family HTH domain